MSSIWQKWPQPRPPLAGGPRFGYLPLVLAAALTTGCGADSSGSAGADVVDAAPLADTGDPNSPAPKDADNPLEDQSVGTADVGGPGADAVVLAGEYEPCDTHADCESNYCVHTWQASVCAPTCTGACEDGWICSQDLTSLPDVVFVCLPAHPQLCYPCRDDGDCQSLGGTQARCVSYGEDGSFCGGDCANLDCPVGFDCQEIALPGDQATGDRLTSQCVRTDGQCTCGQAAIAAAATTDCWVPGEGALEGATCQGERVCLEDGLTDCSAPAPAPESCNGVDDDCDGQTDEGLVGDSCTRDNEFGSCAGTLICDANARSVCGAAEPAAESCNGIDDDCDGDTDELGAAGCQPIYVDGDSDGWGVGEPVCECPGATAGSPKAGDCDDTAASVSPGAEEICNGIDDDCDGDTDEVGALGCTPLYIDGDSDGWGQPDTAACLCGPDGIHTAVDGGDCDDGNGAVSPSATEICNGIDDDCDGEIDGGIDGSSAQGCTVYFLDADDDAWGIDTDFVCTCGPSGAYSAANVGDCDDDAPSVNPTATESCNGVDDDCDGQTDEGAAQGCAFYFADVDADSWGAPGTAICACAPQGSHTATASGDCDDAAADVHPTADESCNGIDDDCDGQTDEAGALGCTTYFADSDQDGFGQTGFSVCTCGPVGIFNATESGDCNDGAASVFPQSVELCNGVDDDCDGAIDEAGAVGCVAFYTDADDDGWGVGDPLCSCSPVGTSTAKSSGDCDDGAPDTNPAALEVCNGIDDDCDGATDEVGAGGCTLYFLDEDGDGYGDAAQSLCACAPSGLYDAVLSGDCHDQSTAVNPGAPELCNGIDDNCDGGIDDGCGLATGGWPTYKYDARRTGHRTDANGPETNALGWTFPLSPGVSVLNSVAIVDDGIVAMAGKSLVKLDFQGQTMWSHTLASSVAWRNSPTVRAGGTVLVPVGGELRLYSQAGALLWTVSLPGEAITAAPIVDAQGFIYVLSSAGLRKVDAAGNVLWVASAPNTQTSPGHPAVSPNGRIHFATSNHSVYAIIPETGQAAWVYTHPSGFDTDSSVAIAPNGDVYQGFGSTVARLDSAGQVLGSSSVGGDMDGDVALLWDPVDDALRVYASPNGNTGLRRYSPTLSLQWTYPLTKDGSSNGVPVFDSDGDAYVGDDTGLFVCVTRTGTLRWSYSTGAPTVKSAAAIGEGFVVFGDGAGVLHFIGAAAVDGGAP